jgi:hypothetical protein
MLTVFRLEMFNPLNRANSNAPNVIVFAPTAVLHTAAVITARQPRRAKFNSD